MRCLFLGRHEGPLTVVCSFIYCIYTYYFCLDTLRSSELAMFIFPPLRNPKIHSRFRRSAFRNQGSREVGHRGATGPFRSDSTTSLDFVTNWGMVWNNIPHPNDWCTGNMEHSDTVHFLPDCVKHRYSSLNRASGQRQNYPSTRSLPMSPQA